MKLFIASLIILFGIVFFLFSLFPSDMSVSRLVLIRASRDTVSRKIADLRSWPGWNRLLPDSTVMPADDSIAAGSVRLARGGLAIHILRKTADSLVTRWESPTGRSFTSLCVLTESNGQAILQWTLEFHLHWYPWEKMASMFYDKQLGPVMEQSLANLRKQIEPA